MILSCTTDEYEITVINKSSSPIIFEFTTGYRLEEYFIDCPGENKNNVWHYSLLKSLGHSMGTFKPVGATSYVDFRYSNYVYTFYDVYIIAFNANGGTLIKDKKELPVMTVVKYNKDLDIPGEEIQLPDGGEIWEYRFFTFSGWAEIPFPSETDLDKIYYVGSLYSSNRDITLYAQWKK